MPSLSGRSDPNLILIEELADEPAEADRDRIASALAAGADPNFEITDSFFSDAHRALIFALDANRADLAHLFLDHGANPHLDSAPQGWTPLMWAAMSPSPLMIPVVHRLLAAGANPNAVSEDGASALLLACKAGHPEAIKALLEAGADPRHRDQSGWGAFHHLALFGHHGLMDRLFQAGAPVNLLGADERRTPLHVALSLVSRKGAQKLLELGAAVSWPDHPEGDQIAAQLDTLIDRSDHADWLRERVRALRLAEQERRAFDQLASEPSRRLPRRSI